MFSFGRLFVSRAATRLPAWAPLRAGFRWKSTTPTATGSQGLPVVPRLDAEDFAFHKEHVDKIIIREPTAEEKEALEKWSEAVSANCRVFVDKALKTNSETLLGYWRLSVRSCSSVDSAVRDFFRFVNFTLETNLSKEDLDDVSLLEWGSAFVEVRFKNTALLTYDELILELQDTIRTSKRCAALSFDYSQLAGVLPNNRAADEERYTEFRELLDRTDRTSGILHFICGDSGSGKTHFAINAVSDTALRRLEALEGSYSNGTSRRDDTAIEKREKILSDLPIVFYINIKNIVVHHYYNTLCSRHAELEKLRNASDDAEKQNARTARNKTASAILADLMWSAMYPYRLKGAGQAKQMLNPPSAFVIVDEAVKSMPMLRALTSEGSDTAGVHLNQTFSDFFSSVRVVAASTASREYLQLPASSRSKMRVFNMTPDRKLVEAELKRQKIELLAKLWEQDTFFYMLTHNKRCAAEVSRLVEYNHRTLLALNEAAGKLFEFKENDPHSQLENSATDTVNLEEEKLNENAHLEIQRHDDPIRLLKEVTLSSVGRQEFSEILNTVTGWLNKHAVLYYKSQNNLADRSAAQCRDIVMRGVFLCATGKTAKLHKFKEDGVATSGKHLRSTLLSKEEIEKATADDPITTGVVAVFHSGKEDDACSVTYSIGLHHLAMAMLNYFQRPPKRDSSELTAPGSGTAGDKQQQQPRQPLTFSGKDGEGFFASLFTFLCQSLLEARVRGDVLSLLDVLDQFRWPSAEASAPMTAEEKEVWDALNSASEHMTNVICDKCALPCPYVTRGRIAKTAFRVFSQRAFNQLNNKLKQKKDVVSVVMNGENAPYADVVIRCGKVLLLVSVKQQCNYGYEEEKRETGEMSTVEKDTAKLGFPFDGEDTAYEYKRQRNTTRGLANSLGCDYVVPVFALFKEPHTDLFESLPIVNVKSPFRRKKKTEPIKDDELRMKPIVLYIRPYMECRVNVTDESTVIKAPKTQRARKTRRRSKKKC